MKILQGRNLDSLFNQGADATSSRVPSRQRCDTRNVVAYRCTANGFFVIEGFASERSVDHQVYFAGLNEIDDVGAALVYFEDAFGFDARALQSGSVPRVAVS